MWVNTLTNEILNYFRWLLSWHSLVSAHGSWSTDTKEPRLQRTGEEILTLEKLGRHWFRNPAPSFPSLLLTQQERALLCRFIPSPRPGGAKKEAATSSPGRGPGPQVLVHKEMRSHR